MAGEKAKLICSFGGEFVSQGGKAFYIGGKTRLVSIDRSATFLSLLVKMSEVCDADPSTVDVKFQLPDGSLESRLISVENDDDVRNMMEEFDRDRKIPVFLFTKMPKSEEEEEDGNGEEDEDEEVDEMEGGGVFAPPPSMMENLVTTADHGTASFRELDIVASQVSFDVHNGLSTPNASSQRQNSRHLAVGPSMTREMFRKDSRSLVVGQEYDDVQTFRNALTSAAIASNFELHMIRSDQRRVTARCAAEGCTWRVHASKLPQVSTFRIRTLTPDHTCVRSDDAGHRQATAKWIANCIRDKLRQNRNYKPREILNDIHQEYGVLITYKRAFLGREKALEELRAEQPARDMISSENNYEPFAESNYTEAQTWGEIHDPPRKKRVHRPPQLKEVRPLHCTRCNQIGHNRRTCTFPESLQG